MVVFFFFFSLGYWTLSEVLEMRNKQKSSNEVDIKTCAVSFQGLRIAPPEAPVTGYMFGKGVYFADMVSKSANYCCTSQSNPTGLILLADVALGNM